MRHWDPPHPRAPLGWLGDWEVLCCCACCCCCAAAAAAAAAVVVVGGGGRCIKSEDKVNISVYLFADAAVAAAATTTAMIAAATAEATRVV